ncbi:hypothetical protein BDV24DRAFT_134042 [Aspergillus arachidicola]|uniref:Uncharacterized protein n=1 Tax=Aspergillus arachidicola TaxID=656916 RepID=A0A5N6Y5Z5_9EURO|nr:hypothetical protein BDV24DRAFT_134042 [Aspergillus arachidicola]
MSWQYLHLSIQFLRKRSESRRAYHGEPLFGPTNSTLHVLVTQARTLFETQKRPSRTQTDGWMYACTYLCTYVAYVPLATEFLSSYVHPRASHVYLH